MKFDRVKHWIIAGTLLCTFAGSLPAQTYTAWVDPTCGSDFTGTVNNAGLPFLTINAAIGAISVRGPTAKDWGVVHVHPGIVSPQTNGEVFPIVMSNYICVHGAGADKVTVIGDQTTAYEGPGWFGVPGVFFPTPLTGSRVFPEVIWELSLLTSTDFDEVVQGFTTRGGDVQLYFETEFGASAVVSNCLFDMLDETPDDSDSLFPFLSGPTFGVLLVSDYLGEGLPYLPPVLKFLNNTTIMGWQPDPSDSLASLVTSQIEAVGFCDVNDPLTLYGSAFTPDPNPTLRGVGDPMVVNSIFRTLPPQSPLSPFWFGLAMLGVDSTDTTIIVGSRMGESCAFDQLLVGTATGLGTFTSAIVAGTILPFPWIDVNPNNPPGASGLARDPGFVGEYINRTYTSVKDGFVRDWRLLPDSVYIDQGSTPLGGMLQTANLTAYVRPQSFVDTYDYDGEHHGNLRIASPPTAPAATGDVDLGFDEASNFIAARSYANDSVSHDQFSVRVQYPGGTAAGQAFREFILPSGGAGEFFALFNTLAPFLPCPPLLPFTTRHFPSSMDPPLVVGGPLGYDRIFLGVPFFIGTFPVAASPVYLAPYEAIPHGFGILSFPNPGAAGFVHTMQGVFIPAAGPPVLTNAVNELY